MCAENGIYFIELWWGHNPIQLELVVYACLCDKFVEVDPNIVELVMSMVDGAYYNNLIFLLCEILLIMEVIMR